MRARCISARGPKIRWRLRPSWSTRGVVATYDGKPINALYSSTCGGRTERRGKHLRRKGAVPGFHELRVQASRAAAVLLVAIRSELEGRRCSRSRACRSSPTPQRFMGLPDRGEPPSTEPGRAGGVHPADVLPVGGDDVRCVVRHRAGAPAADRVGAGGGTAVPAHRQEGARSNGSKASWCPGTGRGCGCW